ncbi:MAG: hypothetical protein ACPG7F_14315 [Aggregatilineales bacterium]
MGKMQTSEATSSPQVAYNFTLDDLAASQTGTDIPTPGGLINTYLLPVRGYIVGYAINKSAAHSAGSLDFDIEVNGTSTLTIQADTTSVYSTINVPDEPFAAGETLGVTYTSDGSLSATTVDVVVTVFVMFEEWDI